MRSRSAFQGELEEGTTPSDRAENLTRQRILRAKPPSAPVQTNSTRQLCRKRFLHIAAKPVKTLRAKACRAFTRPRQRAWQAQNAPPARIRFRLSCALPARKAEAGNRAKNAQRAIKSLYVNILISTKPNISKTQRTLTPVQPSLELQACPALAPVQAELSLARSALYLSGLAVSAGSAGAGACPAP